MFAGRPPGRRCSASGAVPRRPNVGDAFDAVNRHRLIHPAHAPEPGEPTGSPGRSPKSTPLWRRGCRGQTAGWQSDSTCPVSSLVQTRGLWGRAHHLAVDDSPGREPVVNDVHAGSAVHGRPTWPAVEEDVIVAVAGKDAVRIHCLVCIEGLSASRRSRPTALWATPPAPWSMTTRRSGSRSSNSGT